MLPSPYISCNSSLKELRDMRNGHKRGVRQLAVPLYMSRGADQHFSACSMGDTSATEQLHHLNDSFVHGSLTRQEYDELLPFLTSPTSETLQQDVQVQQLIDSTVAAVATPKPRRSVHFADSVPLQSPWKTRPRIGSWHLSRLLRWD